jgi:alkanesulfonate monooxygenase SsuD/methylene tetrahydromethanopterin reductase-like flavin-dependent oxidoreductase (luciferase family)
MNAKSKFGVYVLPWGSEPASLDQITKFAKLAEECGFDSIQIPTHLTLPEVHFFKEFPNKNMLDSFIMAGAIASVTKRIKIGVNASILPALHPFMWAKFVSTLDVLTNGRAIFAGTVGWWKDDFQIPGVDIHKRGQITEEELKAINSLFTDETVDFKGRFYQFQASLEPKPVQKPRPVTWISGGSDRRSIARAARFADYFCTASPPIQNAKQIATILSEETQKARTATKLAVFHFVGITTEQEAVKNEIVPIFNKMAGQAYLHPPSEVSVSDYIMNNSIAGLPQDCIDRINDFQEIGTSYFLTDFYYHGLKSIEYGMKQMELFGDKVLSKL